MQKRQPMKTKKTSLLAVIFVYLTFSGCSWLDQQPEPKSQPQMATAPAQNEPETEPNSVFQAPASTEEQRKECADQKVNVAFDLSKRSQYYLGTYYQTRKPSELFYSWYASQESQAVLNAVKYCWDKKNKHFRAVQNLHETNQNLIKNIRINFRSANYNTLNQIFWDDYQKTFPRDLQ